ncbi:hypothetical protein AC1031_015747 [Aphanomyces cochlioides]|nr:hypothetical protein AC1031_015747 [Aphanomyces cochlioides]
MADGSPTSLLQQAKVLSSGILHHYMLGHAPPAQSKISPFEVTPSKPVHGKNSTISMSVPSDDIRTILDKCRDILASTAPRDALSGLLFEATVHYLIELRFRVASMLAAETYFNERFQLLQDYATKLNVAAASTLNSIKKAKDMMQSYKNEVASLEQSAGQFSQASRDALKRHFPKDTTLLRAEKIALDAQLTACEVSLNSSFPSTVPFLLDPLYSAELEDRIGAARAARAFVNAKSDHRAAVELDRRRRLVVLKNAHTELPHYVPELHADIIATVTEYSLVYSRLDATIRAAATKLNELLLRALCGLTEDAPLTRPTLHSTQVHADLWSKFSSAERVVRDELRLPPALSHWLALLHVPTTEPEAATAITHASHALLTRHVEQLVALQKAHRVNLESLWAERRLNHAASVIKCWKAQLVEATRTTLKGNELMEDGDVRQSHRSELVALVAQTRSMARRVAKAAKQSAQREKQQLETLDGKNRARLEMLRVELLDQSLHHGLLVERIHKRRGAKAVHEVDLDAEKQAWINELTSELHDSLVVAAKRARDAALEALAAEIVHVVLLACDTDAGHDGDSFGELVQRVAELDLSHIDCKVSHVHALEKTLDRARHRVKEMSETKKKQMRTSPSRRIKEEENAAGNANEPRDESKCVGQVDKSHNSKVDDE